MTGQRRKSQRPGEAHRPDATVAAQRRKDRSNAPPPSHGGASTAEHPTPKSLTLTKVLDKVLDRSQYVKGLVDECATDLSSVNDGLEELVTSDRPPAVEAALVKTSVVEEKVQEASDELSIVNKALAHEIDERHLLQRRVKALTEQGVRDRHASLHDGLTGLPNRALFNDRLEIGLAQAKRHGRALAVIFVDLDGFKSINDTHGHEAGDQVLQTVGRRLAEHTRREDTVCRLGGDEFLCVLAEAGEESAIEAVVQKLLVVLRAPIALADIVDEVQVDASVGIALFPRDGDTAVSLIASADRAMYQAKRARSGHAFASRLGCA